MRVVLFSALLVAVAAPCFAEVHVEVPTSGFVFDAGIGGVSSNPLTKVTQFLFRGHAKASSKQLSFSADALRGELGPTHGSRKQVLRHVETTGRTTVIRTIQHGKSVDVTTINGSRFTFDGDEKIGHLKIAGPVEITDTGTEKSNVRLVGDHGIVDFDMRKENVQQALRKAVLDGSVKIDILQSGKETGHIIATGDHLVLDHAQSPATIVMTGKIKMHGEGDSDAGMATGITKLTLFLNDQGKFTHFDLGDPFK